MRVRHLMLSYPCNFLVALPERVEEYSSLTSLDYRRISHSDRMALEVTLYLVYFKSRLATAVWHVQYMTVRYIHFSPPNRAFG